MKVKAKWAVKVDGVWRKAGDVFEMDGANGLPDAVEALKEEPKPARKKAEADPVAEAAHEAVPEPEAKAVPKPRTAARTRKKTTEK